LIVVDALDLVTVEVLGDVVVSILLISKSLKFDHIAFLFLSLEPVIQLDLLILFGQPRNLFDSNSEFLLKAAKRVL
jgi:hypothetical protein